MTSARDGRFVAGKNGVQTIRRRNLPFRLLLNTVNQEAININLKSNGHVHCPCEVCTGEPVYPTTVWRHLQRSKKAKFSNNEVQDEVDCCFTAEPVNTSRTGESVDNCEQITACACGFYSEDTPDEFCNFAENVNDVDEVIVKKSSPKKTCRPTIGRLSADCRPFVGRQFADRRPTVGNVSVTCR